MRAIRENRSCRAKAEFPAPPSSRLPVVELAAFAISAVLAVAVVSQQFQVAAFSSLRLLASGLLNTQKQAAAADNSPTKGERVLHCDLIVLNHYLPAGNIYSPPEGESPYTSQWVAMRWSTEHGKYVAVWWSHIANTTMSKVGAGGGISQGEVGGGGGVRVRKNGVVIQAPRMATITSDYDMEFATREQLSMSGRPALKMPDVRRSTNAGSRIRLDELERLVGVRRGGVGLERLPAVEDAGIGVADGHGHVEMKTGLGSGWKSAASR